VRTPRTQVRWDDDPRRWDTCLPAGGTRFRRRLASADIASCAACAHARGALRRFLKWREFLGHHRLAKLLKAKLLKHGLVTGDPLVPNHLIIAGLRPDRGLKSWLGFPG
jgi:hypothetical protein